MSQEIILMIFSGGCLMLSVVLGFITHALCRRVDELQDTLLDKDALIRNKINTISFQEEKIKDISKENTKLFNLKEQIAKDHRRALDPVKKAPVKKAPVKKAPVKKAPVKKKVAKKPGRKPKQK